MGTNAKIRIDLNDVSFLIPVRVDSEERKANLETLLTLFHRDYITKVVIIEADKKQKIFWKKNTDNVKVEYVYDCDTVFHRTKYINQLLRMAQTPYAAVWDTDAIAPPKQVEEAVEYLRQSKTVMTYPYDGRFYAADKMTSNLFRQTLSYNTLITHIGTMGLMHGYHSPGGAFLVKIKEYLEAGGENENFYGWGQEDNERLKRLEFLGLPVVRANGPLFHLWHPRGQNSWFANREIEIQNRKEILKICRMRKQPTK